LDYTILYLGLKGLISIILNASCFETKNTLFCKIKQKNLESFSKVRVLTQEQIQCISALQFTKLI